jgi:hypothetical protein
VSHSLMGPRVTGQDGGYNFDDFLTPNRTYYLLADRAVRQEIVAREPEPPDQRERIDTPTYYGDATTLDTALPVILRPGEHRDGAEIQIQKAAYYCVDGTANVSGKPAAAPIFIHEQALGATSLYRVGGEAAKDGAFRVCGLTAGQYRLTTNGPQGSIGITDFTVSGTDVHHIQVDMDLVPLHLELKWDGDPPPPPDPKQPDTSHFRTKDDSIFVVQDGAEIKLSPEQYVKLAMTRSTYNVTVQLSGIINGGHYQSQSARPPYEGEFGAVPAGDYVVTPHLAPGCCYLRGMEYNGAPLAGRALHLAPGSHGTLRLLLAIDGGSLTCNVVDANGKPISGATVVLIPADGVMQMPPAGGWKNLAPGKYRVLAVNRPVRLEEDLDKITLALSHAKDVEISAKATIEISLEPVSID